MRIAFPLLLILVAGCSSGITPDVRNAEEGDPVLVEAVGYEVESHAMTEVEGQIPVRVTFAITNLGTTDFTLESLRIHDAELDSAYSISGDTRKVNKLIDPGKDEHVEMRLVATFNPQNTDVMRGGRARAYVIAKLASGDAYRFGFELPITR